MSHLDAGLSAGQPAHYAQTNVALKRALQLCGSVAGVQVVVGALRAALASGAGASVESRIAAGLTVALSCVTIAVGAFGLGLILGALFGIPSQVDSAPSGAPGDPTPGDTDSPRMVHNDSLVRISNWLSTAIVGATLVQLKDLGSQLARAGAAAAQAVLDTSEAPAAIVGAALIVSFVVGGLVVGYLWTRIYFFRDLATLQRERLGEVAAIEARAELSDTIQARPGTVAAAAEEVKRQLRQISDQGEKEPADPEDPWKSRFGGSASRDGYQLSATVSPTRDRDLFAVKVRLTRRAPPVSDAQPAKVTFFLHPTFPVPVVERQLNRLGSCTLSLMAWGAFTIGAKVENGPELELDLSELESAPDAFRER